MNEQEKIIALRVMEIIAEKLCLDLREVAGDKKLGADLGADSLDAVDIALALDEAFGMELPDELFALDHTVQHILNFIITAKAPHDTPPA